MTYVLGKTSKERLGTVAEDLQKVIERAIELTEQDFSVLEGARTRQRQYELYAMGRTLSELRVAGVPANILAKPGEPKVTWTLNSRHFPNAKTGLGNAVDLVPYPVDFSDLAKYTKIKEAVFKAAGELSIRIRWGGDWNQNGKTEHGENDFGHFELG